MCNILVIVLVFQSFQQSASCMYSEIFAAIELNFPLFDFYRLLYLLNNLVNQINLAPSNIIVGIIHNNLVNQINQINLAPSDIIVGIIHILLDIDKIH